MAETTLRVLLVEDDEDDYLLVRDYLGEAGGAPLALEWAPTYAAGLAALARRAHDVALIDYRLGASSGLDLLLAARLAGDLPPAIVLTGAGDPAVDAAAQAAGAADYLVKGHLDAAALARAIRYTLDRARQRAALAGAEAFLQATLDALSAHIAVLDDRGTIVAVNAAWRRFARANGYAGDGCGLGADYLAACDAATGADAPEAAAVASGHPRHPRGARRDVRAGIPLPQPDRAALVRGPRHPLRRRRPATRCGGPRGYHRAPGGRGGATGERAGLPDAAGKGG